ncbi:heterotrimeric G protein alpha subunit [Cylindrobasidium torrendii FP15055 ss-10]|uniref:Heterotrimeric G protein alpha subunit n=1 Tax=Cylindrobasidium torrendii FP15055 ss-10 TaxID=1314674 RepID=A0A0D7BD11_9AGAR|nr:heterotrimeric G protein alpha subunit [Cylindrobasidium torrendii FP15055 ss-10]
MVTRPDDINPFTNTIRPPPNETPTEMTARLKSEEEAKRRSDKIDEDIQQARKQAKRERNIVKVLLLGQAESGKSTTLKNFRMCYAPQDWERERAGWRAVVQLNVVRSIVSILNIVEAEINGEPVHDYSGSDSDSDASLLEDTFRFTPSHQLLVVKLAALRSVETDLQRTLGLGVDAAQFSLSMSATPFDAYNTGSSARRKTRELAVRHWAQAVKTNDNVRSIDSVAEVLANLKNEMITLWNDKTVQLVLERRRMRLPDSAEFFLAQLDRIATRTYSVSDDDIVRARLRTVGIQEYEVQFNHSPVEVPLVDGAWKWRIYDVGGCRTMRAAWLPFFENTNAVIFMCPLSCFDERLDEDPAVNRLEDSTILWQAICSTKILERTQLIVFMNKCDLLKRKLKQGVQVKNYLTSYGSRPNTVREVVSYLRDRFKDMQHKLSPRPRHTYIYPTTVTDTRETAKTLETVRDGVIRENLSNSQLL